jgi:hypothetical protein
MHHAISINRGTLIVNPSVLFNEFTPIAKTTDRFPRSEVGKVRFDCSLNEQLPLTNCVGLSKRSE